MNVYRCKESLAEGKSTQGVGLVLFWIFLGLNGQGSNATVITSGVEEASETAFFTCNTSHGSPPPFYNHDGYLTNNLFSLVTSTNIEYNYIVEKSEGTGQQSSLFMPAFTGGKNRWDVVVGTTTGFNSTQWSFRCTATSKQVEMANEARIVTLRKSLFFGWMRKCRLSERHIYLIVFVRNLHVYVRAYTNRGEGKDIQLVAAIGLAKKLPVHAEGRVYVCGAGKEYLSAALALGKKQKGMKGKHWRIYTGKPANMMKSMVISAEGDEELQNVFPSMVSYRELYYKNEFLPISRFNRQRYCRFETRNETVSSEKNSAEYPLHKMSIESLLNP